MGTIFDVVMLTGIVVGIFLLGYSAGQLMEKKKQKKDDLILRAQIGRLGNQVLDVFKEQRLDQLRELEPGEGNNITNTDRYPG